VHSIYWDVSGCPANQIFPSLWKSRYITVFKRTWYTLPGIVRSCPPQLQVFQWSQVLLCVSHCHFSTQVRKALISLTFICASYISYSTWSKANSFVMHVTAVLLFCYCKLCIMALPQYDTLKQLCVLREYYHSDDYAPQQFMSFLLSVGCADMTSISYFPFRAL